MCNEIRVSTTIAKYMKKKDMYSTTHMDVYVY